jgi:hypothetical protein
LPAIFAVACWRRRALCVYALTLNRWVSLFNLGYVAKTSGWTWQPELMNPLSFLRHLSVPLAAGGAIPSR